MTVTSKQSKQMIEMALVIREYAYAPYSNYRVGAVLLTSVGHDLSQRFTPGTNVENASYGLTLCAERVALFSAIANYGVTSRVFDTMVIATRNGATSCGACLQVMMEFNPDMDLIFVDEEGKIIDVAMVKDLLHSSFIGDDIIEG